MRLVRMTRNATGRAGVVAVRAIGRRHRRDANRDNVARLLNPAVARISAPTQVRA